MTNSIWRRTSLLPLLFLYYKRNASFHFCNLSAAALASSRTRHNREAPAPGCRDGSVAQTHPPPATSPVWPAAAVCRVWCIRLGTQACCEHGSSVHNHPLRSECPGFGDKCSRIQGRSRCNCAPNSQPGQPPGSTIEAIILVPCHPSASPSVHIVPTIVSRARCTHEWALCHCEQIQYPSPCNLRSRSNRCRPRNAACGGIWQGCQAQRTLYGALPANHSSPAGAASSS
jgi:hypothetical protein